MCQGVGFNRKPAVFNAIEKEVKRKNAFPIVRSFACICDAVNALRLLAPTVVHLLFAPPSSVFPVTLTEKRVAKVLKAVLSKTCDRISLFVIDGYTTPAVSSILKSTSLSLPHQLVACGVEAVVFWDSSQSSSSSSSPALPTTKASVKFAHSFYENLLEKPFALEEAMIIGLESAGR
jgi:hypothetical protein